jgi:hypothetical protein
MLVVTIAYSGSRSFVSFTDTLQVVLVPSHGAQRVGVVDVSRWPPSHRGGRKRPSRSPNHGAIGPRSGHLARRVVGQREVHARHRARTRIQLRQAHLCYVAKGVIAQRRRTPTKDGGSTEGGLGECVTPARSASIQEGASDEIDGYLGVVLGRGSEPRQIGGASLLASGIQAAEADNQVTQRGQLRGKKSEAPVRVRLIIPEPNLCNLPERQLKRPSAHYCGLVRRGNGLPAGSQGVREDR